MKFSENIYQIIFSVHTKNKEVSCKIKLDIYQQTAAACKAKAYGGFIFRLSSLCILLLP